MAEKTAEKVLAEEPCEEKSEGAVETEVEGVTEGNAGESAKGKAGKKGKKGKKEAAAASERIICPFCGRVSDSLDHCSKCNSLFNKEVRSIAYTEETDPRSDQVGPFSTKVAKRLLWVLIAVLILLFAVFTQNLAVSGK